MELSQDSINFAMRAITSSLSKDMKTFASIHEMLGVLTVEFDKLKMAVDKGTMAAVFEKMIDIGAIATVGIASIRESTQKTTLWTPDNKIIG